MRANHMKTILKAAVLIFTILPFAAVAAFGQQQVFLTAGPATATMPDGAQVPMWGYSCGTAVSGSTATCAPLNPASLGGWSPVVITVPTGGGLTINLTNNLSFLNGNTVPTSIVIVGQIGGGLGTSRTTTPSPDHSNLASDTVTWPTVGATPSLVPPPQGPRVQSFATEVPVGTTTALTWANLRPGTYLLESGTHPSIQVPMGLYGILVVTSAPTATAGVETAPGTAYPTVAYDAEVPLAFSEIDPVQNNAVNTAVNTAGFSETQVWSRQPGVVAGPITSIAVNLGGTLYTAPPVVTIAGSGSNATAVATLTGGVVTGITITDAGDGYAPCTVASTTCPTPTVVTIAPAATDTTGSGATATATVTLGGCGGGAHTCYPPAVNYTPLYYTINGVAFNRTNAGSSLFPVGPAMIAPTSGTGNVLVRLVNAGSRMHVPSIVGSQVAGQTGGTTPIVTGFKIIAEDGNPLPGLPKVKSDVFMAAGKTFDVMINGQATSGTTIAAYPTALAVYDRELSLSGNATERDAGMLAYIGINGATLPVATGTTATPTPAVANPDTYSLVPGQILTISDPSRGVIANDKGVYLVQLLAAPSNGTVTLNANGTFVYYPNPGITTDSFTYCANGGVTGTTCSSNISTTVTLGPSSVADSGITCTVPTPTYTASMATYLAVKTPGVLAFCKDGANLPLTVNTSLVSATGMTVLADGNGGFTATAPSAGTYSFTVAVQNPKQQTATANVTVVFPPGSGLTVNVVDGYDKTTPITDYRWIIEEDRTFYIDPRCTSNPPPTGCPTSGSGIVPTLGTNFHTSYMPYVAQGCTGAVSCEGGQTAVDPTTGLHNPVACDVGNGVCRPDPGQLGFTAVLPGQVSLDPKKRYYISVLPGDAANPFYGAAAIGHGMGGAPFSYNGTAWVGSAGSAAGQSPIQVITQPSPYQPAKLSVFVFEDDFPLNGEQDGGGGVDVLSPQEPGLGGFQIHLWDAMGGNGDFTGQMTYDMFNQPLTNSLAGTKDPNNGNDACPITANPLNSGSGTTDPTATGITGMIVTCPTYESDGKTLSPLAGQAVVANLMPGRWGAIATPGADRIARGEEWLQTNTLDGQKAHDVFTRIGEPSYFQEYGPASYHVSIGFANPAIINSRHPYVCNGTDPSVTGVNCNNTIKGIVTGEHLSRTPDERLYSSGSHDTFYWSQCYVSFGDVDGEDFAFTKCNADGTFTLTGLPDGDWRVTVFDQWNDLLVDGLSTPIGLSKGKTGGTTTMEIPTTQWQANLYTQTFIDDNKSGVSKDHGVGIPFANVAVRLRDGSLENLLVTDFTGTANFNETFPLFSWYTVETDVTRYKNTGTHVVYDVGGPVDSSASCGTTGYPPCGTSVIGKNLASTAEIVSVPTNLRVPGAVYCADADCSTHPNGILGGPASSDPPSVCNTSAATTTAPPLTTCTTQLSSGRIDPPWVGVEGWQGFPGQNNFLEFGKEPYVAGENGGIKGHVVYASTRPFDDPQALVQTQWEPLVPHVTINLYQEGFAPDGITPTLTLVDHTQTSSFDDWAQGFHVDAHGNTVPNMNCPGQGASSGAIPDLFFFSLYNQPNYLDFYNNVLHGTAANPTSLPNNSQFKCYDGMHNWNQLQPAPYDGMYQFPSVTSTDPTTGKPTTTNCTICKPNTVVPSTDLYSGLPMLPTGKYVVEVVLPQGYELVKEEDKNILIGDNFIAPVTQQFGAMGNIFIIPDQASVAGTVFGVGSGYNANNAQNPTQSFGATPENGIVPGFVPEPIWPCVGEARIVPDYISLYPQSHQVAPFAGATRNLCDRKEVTLGDQMGAIAKFFIYTSTHIASKFTGGITDDYTSEFDPFSPQFGEKFAPPDLPVSVKDWAGNEISRVYADHWGSYDGMTYSTWEVNPPNPTGYSPTMMVFCMNDPGPIPGPNGTMITDPQYTVGYSQFCYELPFMPGTTQYLDTPVVPTSAFAGAGYNNVDCAYPTLTPAIAEVDGDQVGPWVSAPLHTLTITALGDQTVPNYAYSGPAATTAPYNQKTISRHYGFGAAQGTGSVTIGGINAPVTSWSDTSITVAVPPGVPACAVQQQAQYGGSTARCGELVITAGNGRQSIDTVTVTIGGSAPAHVLASGTIQSAIDAANPGDLIIIDPTCSTATASGVACSTPGVTTKSAAAHSELLLMWKPVRLQGVGAASSIINANTHPAGKLDAWRQRVNCLFGLNLSGTFISTTNPYDPTGAVTCGSTGGVPWKAFNAFDGTNAQVDPIPTEAVIGWDASQNGNLAQLLQEPSLMGALEGAGITVLSKGVNFSAPPTSATAAEGAFPTGTTLLTGPVTNKGIYATGDANALCHMSSTNKNNPFPSNFQCNPSSIDGLGITDSSQGGGGIFVHAWGHNLQIANNHIYSNAGTLAGGINLGQGEFAPQYIQGATNLAPGSCVTSGVTTNAQLPYCENISVNIHHNNISLNSSTGDELFSATPAGAGGVSLCTGADYYKFNYNWVCGNLSSGDGGGVGHLGFNFNGDIEHNSILFNQSLNPTIPANGGGLVVMGTPDVDNTCGVTTDQDCVSIPNTITPSDGVGPNLVINGNLIMGNAAESGSGGGLRLQAVNGSDVLAFPTTPSQWFSPSITNNIIADNVAGWDGAGISLLDALNVNIINNTIVSNSTTASAGILFTTVGAPLASSEGTNSKNCIIGTETSCPQIAGLVTIQNSVVLRANLPTTINCPAGHYQGTTSSNGTCRNFSYPLLENNIFWQNSAYYIGVGALSPQYQQNVVSLYNAFTTTLAPTQPQTDATTAHGSGVTITGGTGACVAANYWDIGVRGDTTPGTAAPGNPRLAPIYSVITDATDYPGLHNTASSPNFASQYCDGARTPPEFAASGWAVPPGISDATVPNPIFNLTPVATVDEGNNWINMRWGPLTLLNPVTNTQLANYALTTGSPVISTVTTSEPNYSLVPGTDFFGNSRPETGSDTTFDPGAVEFGSSHPVAVLSVTGGPLAFGNQAVGFSSAAKTLTLHNNGTGAATLGGLSFSSTVFSQPTGAAGGTCNTTLNAGATCTINVVFTPTAAGPVAGTVTIFANVAVAGSPVGLSGTGVADVTSASLTPATWTVSQVRDCPGTTLAQMLACFLDPAQVFRLTNTGNVPLTSIAQGVLGGANTNEYSVVRLLSTCGPATGGQLQGITTLAPGASCVVTVQFKPLTGLSTGLKPATISVTDAAGTQTSILNGTAQ
jgi:Bacterial Ig domain